MTLKVDVETLDAVRRRFAVEVPAEEVRAEVEKAYVQLARAAKVPGFRPGRVPRQVLERMFGDRVRADAFDRLIQRSYAEVVDEQHIDVLGRPEIVTEQAEPGGPLRYHATVEVRPDIVVSHYDGLAVDRRAVEVSAADVDVFLGRLRESLAQLHPITDRPEAKAGDVVTLSYEARVAGRLVGRADSREVEIGANGFPPEFDRALVGAAVGTELHVSAAYPADRGGPEVAGKTVDFVVHVQRLSRKELPALDDDFAKDHGECDTLAELRERVRRRLEAEAAQTADEEMRRGVLGELSKAHDIPVPQALVQRRTEALVEEARREWRQHRIRPKNEAEALDRLRRELEPRAREQVKCDLLLEAIARQEHLSVSEEEIDARIAALAAEAGAAGERVRALYQNPEARQHLRTRLQQARAVDVVVSRARITEVRVPSSNIAEVSENG